MVIQLKAQLDDSQNFMNQSSINLSIVENKPDLYNAETSSHELYNILINKESRISELTHLVQKLEANVFDLQENIKEKDQVIDARTKAITLMSENLSKKGKNALDNLEDTKEQMRKMQENFIQLEGEMNKEKQNILLELHQKNLETESLKEAVFTAEKRIETSKIEDYEKLVEELNRLKELVSKKEEITKAMSKENQVSANKITELEKLIQGLKLEAGDKSSQSEEVVKLKKQLDESNKSMIKMKAQHKSKIKELNKKIDALKKSVNPNSGAEELASDVCKLNEKIFELEKEKEELLSHIDQSSPKKGNMYFLLYSVIMLYVLD